MTAYVYALEGDGAVRYVGVTLHPVERRLCHALGYARPTQAWVRSLGGALRMLTLQAVCPSERFVREREWVDALRARGFALLNRENEEAVRHGIRMGPSWVRSAIEQSKEGSEK